MEIQPFKFTTDTASCCVYDLGALKHRLEDDADWWCWPSDIPVNELNSGNVAFIDLGRDGVYTGHVQFGPLTQPTIEFRLSCPTGCVFVGAAEETTSEGMEPDCTRGGVFVQVAVDAITIQMKKADASHIVLAIFDSDAPASNNFTEPLKL